MAGRPLRIVHVADTHLDPPLRYLGPRVEERRRDFLKAFDYVVEKVLELKPDVMLVAGDLYDRVNPRNPPRTWVMRAFRRVRSEGVRVYVVGGNHDTPRSVEEGASPLHELDAAGYVQFFSSVSRMDADTFEVGGYTICISGASFNHTLPLEEDPLASMKVPLEGGINVAMLHYNFAPARAPPMWAAPTIREASIPRGLHYLALGHYHRYYAGKVGEARVVYPGSTERRSFVEEGERKGFVYAEVGEEGVERLEFIETEPRPMRTVEVEVGEDVDDPIERVVKAAMRFADRRALARLRIKGRLPLEKLVRYNRGEVVKRLESLFFHVIVDDRGLECAMEEPELTDLEELSPLKLYEDYMNRLISEAKEAGSEERVGVLQEARRRGKELLEEVGAW